MSLAEFVKEATTGCAPSPTVDLVFTLRNTSDHPISLLPPRNDSFDVFLIGRGAINFPEQEVQTGLSRREDNVTLAPGKSLSIPIQSLDSGDCKRSYWLMPGEYDLHVSCRLCIDPAPKAARFKGETFGCVSVVAPPLKVKVVAKRA
jgi:hypothetical protein